MLASLSLMEICGTAHLFRYEVMQGMYERTIYTRTAGLVLVRGPTHNPPSCPLPSVLIWSRTALRRRRPRFGRIPSTSTVPPPREARTVDLSEASTSSWHWE